MSSQKDALHQMLPS